MEVRASQVTWMREHIAAGGWPLFLVQWGDIFMVVPGRWASDLRHNPSLENCLRLASNIWTDELPVREFLRVLRKPENEYARTERNLGEARE